MTLEELQNLGDIDLKIDDQSLDTESTKVPYKISKWLKWLNDCKLQHLLEDAEYKEMYRERYNSYYVGTTNVKLTKDEILKIYLPADKDLIKLDNIRKYTEQKMRYIESVITALSKFAFSIKNAIDWQKFQQGR